MKETKPEFVKQTKKVIDPTVILIGVLLLFALGITFTGVCTVHLVKFEYRRGQFLSFVSGTRAAGGEVVDVLHTHLIARKVVMPAEISAEDLRILISQESAGRIEVLDLSKTEFTEDDKAELGITDDSRIGFIIWGGKK